jgi:hypothetical protein
MEGTYAIMPSTPDGSNSGLSNKWIWILIGAGVLIVVIILIVVLSSGSHSSAPSPNAPDVLPYDWTLEGRDDLFVFIKNNIHIGEDCARIVAKIVMNNVYEEDYEKNKMGVVSDVVKTKVPCIGTKGNWSDATLKGYLTSLLSKRGDDALLPYPLSTGCSTCVAKRIMQDYEPDNFILKTMSPSPDFLSYLIKPDPNCNVFCMK